LDEIQRNYAVRSEHYRYIRYLDGSEELYDHRKDPHEWDNLAGLKKQDDQAAVIKEHRRHLPKKEAEVLPASSSGHKAYEAASRFVRP